MAGTLHERISGDLRGRIHDRELTPGDLLPSESAMQETYSVSRSVVRQALATLESEGLVRRARGRGTIVAPRAELHRGVDVGSGLMAQLQQHGTSTTTEVLRLETSAPPQHLVELGAEVVLLERLRSVDGMPVAFIRTYLPIDVGSAISRESLTDRSLHGVVAQATGRRVTDGSRTVRAVATAPPLDTLLQVEAGSPLLLLEGTSLDQDAVPIEVFSTWHRSDTVAFDVALRPEPSTASALDRAVALADDLAAELRARRG